MDKQPSVVFRNVGQVYFPQTKVECHYSLTPDLRWSSSDWIGIFEVGWSSLKQYHTYTWALVPEGYTEGSNVNFCANFSASYLPRPSAVEYQFVYVDKAGEVRGRSRAFTFCAPKPLEELETMQEERDGEEDGEEGEEEELLLVIPRAQLLQRRLEECLKKQADMQRALDLTKQETETDKEDSKRAMQEWEHEREAMRDEIAELRDNLRLNCETLKRMAGKQEDVRYSQENMSSEMSKLLADKAESQQRIKELEEDVESLTDRKREEVLELERLKERVKKMSSQMKHDEEKRKALQLENEAALSESRGLQERLEASEHVAESLRRELRELGTRQGHAHTELHQARLQVAQLTLQLTEENLVLREDRANWALEREAYKHNAESDKRKLQELSCEVQRKEQWLQEERVEREKVEAELAAERDCNRVQLSDAKRELLELKAGLRKAQKERDEHQAERQNLKNYIHQLEQRSAAEADAETPTCVSPGGSSSSEDDSDADRAETHTESGQDTQDGQRQQREKSAGDLNLPGLLDPVLSGLAESYMW